MSQLRSIGRWCYNQIMKHIDSLEQLGLTKNEVRVYTYLLRVDEAEGSTIKSVLNLDKSSTYRSLRELEGKGLIYRIGESRNQKFVAYPAKRILELQLKQERKLRQNRNEIKQFLGDVKKYAKKNYKSSNIQVYEGSEGYIAWNDARLYKPGSTVREMTTRRAFAHHLTDYYSYMRKYVKKRVYKKIHMRVLFDNSEENDHIDITSDELLKEVRQLNQDLKLDAIMSTFGTKSGFYSGTGKAAMGIIINDTLITNLLCSMYDVLWEKAEKVF